MAYELEKEYLSKLPPSPLSSLQADELDKILFSAREELSMYHPRHITPRVIILQAMYIVNKNSSEYEQLKKQGIQSMSTKRGSISFQANASGYTGISPDVLDILGAPPSYVGRLY